MKSQREIRRALRELGIASGDHCMVHASLRALGVMERRGEGLVASLLQVVGPKGTLLAYVDYEPTDAIPYFDPEHSPAASDHGALAEIIRTWPGAVRSLNPGASVSAIGGESQWFCHDHSKDYGYGSNSPFGKLVENAGKILLLGSHFDHVTMIHHAEHLARLPGKKVIHRSDAVTEAGVVTDQTTEEFDTSGPVVAGMPENYFAIITQAFVDAGHARVGTVGDAHSVLLPAQTFVTFAVEKMEQEFGHT